MVFKAISTFFFLLYRAGQCTYPSHPGILFTSTLSIQWHSHVISIVAAKLSSEHAKLRRGKRGRGESEKKKIQFRAFQDVFSTNFVPFFTHFLSILFSEFIGVVYRTNRQYWCCECCTSVYALAIFSPSH